MQASHVVNSDFLHNFKATGSVSSSHQYACRDEEAGHKVLHHPEAVDDSHLQWVSPDEATILPFSRQREDALVLASEYDLCISGDGLTHLHKIGADAAFLPLAQVQPMSSQASLFARSSWDHTDGLLAPSAFPEVFAFSSLARSVSSCRLCKLPVIFGPWAQCLKTNTGHT